jgi:hypothetical protein
MRAAIAVLAAALAAFPAVVSAQVDQPSTEQLPRYFIDAVERATECPPPPPPPDTDINAPAAGGRYIVLMRQVPGGLREQVSFVSPSLAAFSVNANKKKVSPESASAALQAAQPWVEQLCEAAALKDGDLRLAGSFRDAGMAEGDPRRGLLVNLVNVGDILRADAVRLWTAGQRDAALGRLGAAIGIARHLGGERFNLTSQKFGATQLRKSSELLAAMRTAAGKGGVPDSPALARAAALLDLADPVGLHRGWREHALATIEFAEKNCREEHVGLPLLADLATSRGTGDWITPFFQSAAKGKQLKESGLLDPKDVARLSRELHEKLGNLTPAQVRIVVERARPMVDELDKAWDRPDAEITALRQSAEIEKDKTGVLKLILMYPPGAVRDWTQSVASAKQIGAGR